MRFRTWLFQLELRLLSMGGWDCSTCVQREIDRGRGVTFPLGEYRMLRPLRLGFTKKAE